MNNEQQIKQRQLDNERILVSMLRGAKPTAKTPIQQLRATVADMAEKARNEMRLVK